MVIPKIYAIANIKDFDTGLEYFNALLESSIELIQLRAKEFSLSDFSEFAAKALDLRDKNGYRTRIIINDSPEICFEIKADGVHLGQQDADPEQARKILGENSIIGLSTHNLDQVIDANNRNKHIKCLDYIGFGPVFDSPTKSGHAPSIGLNKLHEAALRSELPLVAIGGITSENSKDVFRAGASSIAVISDLEHAALNGSNALKNKIQDLSS